MTMTVKLDPLLEQRLRLRSAASGRPAGEIIREALVAWLDEAPEATPSPASCSSAKSPRRHCSPMLPPRRNTEHGTSAVHSWWLLGARGVGDKCPPPRELSTAMKDLSPTDLKSILHSKRANLYYLQHCRVLVQRNDRVVGELLLTLSACGHEREFDRKFTAAGAEYGFGGGMAAHADAIGFPQTLDFVRALRGAVEIEPSHQVFRVDGGETEGMQLREIR